MTKQTTQTLVQILRQFFVAQIFIGAHTQTPETPPETPPVTGLFDFVRERSGFVEICDFCNHIDCSHRTITYGEWGNSNFVLVGGDK